MISRYTINGVGWMINRLMNGTLQHYKTNLIRFSRESRKLYIYGAGNYGRGYLDILQHNGCDADGFIVTKKRSVEYMGKPVYSVEELLESIAPEDGIIPAFTNSNTDEIEARFIYAKPRILKFNDKIMLCLEDEIHFTPLIESLDCKFPEVKHEIDRMEWNDILVVRLDAIGDMVFTTPFLRELRKNFPDGHISAVVRRQNQKLLEDCPYIDELFLYDSGLSSGELADQCLEYPQYFARTQDFVDKCFQSRRFDVVFFPRELLCGRNAIEELLIAYYSGAKCRIGRSMANEEEKRFICDTLYDSFTMIFKPKFPMHESAYALEMLRQCGCLVEDERMELWTNRRSEEYIEQIFTEYQIKTNQILVAIGIVASVDTRTWKPENYNEVVRHYGERYGNHIRFIIMGGDDAKNAAAQIDGRYGNIINLAGRTDLDETVVGVKRCNLYVGSNTGLLHFASAWGVPSVTIYSELSDGNPTDGDSPFRMGAWKAPHIDLVPPAGLDGCHGVCRMSFSHCINLITPSQVIASIDQLLGLGDMDKGGWGRERESI